MKIEDIKRIVLPPGPVLGLTLLGILLISALLYYRSVKIQRFLEPALALSQPRSEFAFAVNTLLAEELKTAGIQGVRFELGALIVEESLIFDRHHRMKDSAIHLQKKLGNVLLAVLKDETMRSDIDLILVTAEFPVTPGRDMDRRAQLRAQHKAEAVLGSLVKVQPFLGKDYATYFASTALPMNPSQRPAPVIKYIFIPSEQLHIKVLQSLRKYVM
ncbi:MAG: hypothetical protein ACM34I_02960 [bacterium]